MHHSHQDTIVALSTPPGVGAIGVIRLSGNEAINITNTVFKGTDLASVTSHTVHFGTIRDADQVIDEVLVTVFIAPKSFTREMWWRSVVMAPITYLSRSFSY